jgi:outer membrane immunogenic protein
MKRIVLAAALAFSAVPALAADLPAPAPPPRAPAAYVPVAAPIYNWSGIYVGINGGGDFGQLKGFGASVDTSGYLFGGTIGANFQTGQVVFGVEADGDWAPINVSGGGGSITDNWAGTVRGRLGYAIDRLLIYGTGGGAWDVCNDTVNCGFTSAWGWTAGGGLEYAFAQNWTAKIEYLYINFADVAPGISMDQNVIRGGINFKFNPF